jgi:hypothetical protein
VTDVVIARAPGEIHTITTLQGADIRPLRHRVLDAGYQAAKALASTPPRPRPALDPAPEVQRHATIACIIPCYNEQDSIADVLTSLLAQTRLPDVVHVIINNTDDDTLEIAQRFEGHHTRTVKGQQYETQVHIHDRSTPTSRSI